jgi:hypothetical protein
MEPTERTALANAADAVAADAERARHSWFTGERPVVPVDRRGACALLGLLVVSVVAGLIAAAGSKRAGEGLHERREPTVLLAQKVEPPPPMNSDAAYIINNAPSKGSDQVGFSSTEFFEVYTDLIPISYLQVHWQDHDLEIPMDIRLRFRGQTMGIVGWEVDIVRGEGAAESSVPNHEIYHHHHVATWWGLPALRTGRLFTNRTHSRIQLDPDERPAHQRMQVKTLLRGVKRVQVTNLINGGENRNTFTGFPRGFAQPIEEPSTVRLTAMLISTLNTDVSGTAQRGGPIPRESLRPASEVHSAPTDCPCTDLVQPRWSEAEQAVLDLKVTPEQIGWCRTRSLLDEGNPSCAPRTYKGGLSCCYDNARLLNQEQLAGEAASLVQHVELVRMKYRVYFTGFEPNAAQAQLPVHALEWSLLGCRMSECIHPEFDVPPAPRGVPAAPEAVHHLESSILVRDLFTSVDRPCDFERDANCVPLEMAPAGVALVYANFHCHPPACLDAGLWNDETGELICQVTAVYGKGDSAADDAGYHRVPPCLWGSTEDGLRPPPMLSLDTRLRGSMRSNSTYGQYGMMGIWMLRVASSTEVETAAMDASSVFAGMLGAGAAAA